MEGQLEGGSWLLQGMERPPKQGLILTGQPVQALWPPTRVQLGTAGCKTSVRFYLHLIYIQVC